MISEIELKSFYFTWGFNQGHDNCYTIIEARDSEEARRVMFQIWGDKWGFQYNSSEEAGVEK